MESLANRNQMLNLLELMELRPLQPFEMLSIDLGTVFDGFTDTTPDRIETSMRADGRSLSLCEDGSGLPACAEGAGLSVCVAGGRSETPLSMCEDGGPSDVRLKTDIVQVGTTVYGLPLYQFRYRTGPERFEGVMAQDVLEVMPDAVATGEDGYYRVNYGRLGIRMTKA